MDPESIEVQFRVMQLGGGLSVPRGLSTNGSAQIQYRELLRPPEVVKMVGAINAYATSKFN